METSNKLQQKKRGGSLLLISSLMLSTFLVLITVSSSSCSPACILTNRGRNCISAVKSNLCRVKVAKGSNFNVSITPLACLISGSIRDGMSFKRSLKALYHPWNQSLLHLDLEGSAEERLELVRWVNCEKLFQEVGNVKVVQIEGRAD